MNHLKFLQAIASRDYESLLKDGGENLSTDQLETVKRMASEDSQLELQRKGAQVASNPGYNEFMSTPIMSRVASEGFGKNKNKTAVPQQEQSNVKENKKDPEFTSISPKSTQNLKVGDTEADVIAKLYNLLQKRDSFNKKRQKEAEKIRKETDPLKQERMKEIISSLGGDTSGIAGSKKHKVKSGILNKLGLGVMLVGGTMMTSKAYASVKKLDIDKLFPSITDLLNKDKHVKEAADVPQDWQKDTEFLKKVQEYADEMGIKFSDLMAVMAAESGLKPTAQNPVTKATGLIQFMPKTAEELGTNVDEIKNMSRSEQFELVKKYFKKKNLKPGSSEADIYAKVFLPARSDRDILTQKGEKFYDANVGLDIPSFKGGEKKGYISKSDLSKFAESKKRSFNIPESAPKPVVPQIAIPNKIDEMETKNKENVEIKKEMKKTNEQLSLLNNTTNVYNAGTTYVYKSTKPNDNPKLLEKQYYYV